MTITSEGPGWADDEARRLAEDLRHSVSRFVRMVRQKSGTTRTAQSETLDLLNRLGPVNVAALAQARGVTHQTMRLVVSQLEASGLTNGEADASDRRSRVVSLLPAGRDRLAQEREARTIVIATAIEAKLSAEERDILRDAISILDRLSVSSS